MNAMGLTADELNDVLVRAEEIQRASLGALERDADVRAVIEAGEEVGIERAAIERAIRERLDVPLESPRVGDLVFAKSADDKYYVAEVLSSTAADVGVRYLSGSEATVAADQVRPCRFRPGERVTVNWPWWGPYPCNVVSYDARQKRVKLSDGWGSTKTFDVAQVWQERPKKPGPSPRNRARIYITLIGAGSGIGALIGSALTWLLLR